MALRDTWIEKREAAQAAANGNGNSTHASNGRNMSQMPLPRLGSITEEMQYVATKRERLEPELIRSEVARGRCIIPANIHHRNLEPMAIGIATKCKINANIHQYSPWASHTSTVMNGGDLLLGSVCAEGFFALRSRAHAAFQSEKRVADEDRRFCV
jgi:hypothetical protein